MNHSIVVKPTEINPVPVGQAVPEPEELFGGTQAMKECPRFDGCNAPICPLDPDVLDRVHAKGDSVCYYLRLYVKNALWGRKNGERTGESNDQNSCGLLPANGPLRSPKRCT